MRLYEILKTIVDFYQKSFENLLTLMSFFGIMPFVMKKSNFYGGIPKCLLTWLRQKPLNANGM